MNESSFRKPKNKLNFSRELQKSCSGNLNLFKRNLKSVEYFIELLMGLRWASRNSVHYLGHVKWALEKVFLRISDTL
jgi:hypothetical protein